MLRWKTVLLGCVMALAAAAAHAELISNGSFESPSLGQTQYGTASSLDNWTISNVTLVNGAPFNNNFKPEDGSQFVVLTASGAGGPNGSVSQQIATTVGTKYELTFSYGALSNGNAKTGYLTYNVTNSSGTKDATDTLSIDTTGAGDLQLVGWYQKTIDFVATSTSTTVSFSGNNISSDPKWWYGVTLDNVSVKTVPEPSTTILGVFGVGGLLAYAWRKRRS